MHCPGAVHVRGRPTRKGAAQVGRLEATWRFRSCCRKTASPPVELEAWGPHGHTSPWKGHPRRALPRVPHPQNIQDSALFSSCRSTPVILIDFQAFSCTADLSTCFWEVLGDGCPAIGNARQCQAIALSYSQVLPDHETLIACPKPLAALHLCLPRNVCLAVLT